jgi:hypothetical protein
LLPFVLSDIKGQTTSGFLQGGVNNATRIDISAIKRKIKASDIEVSQRNEVQNKFKVQAGDVK